MKAGCSVNLFDCCALAPGLPLGEVGKKGCKLRFLEDSSVSDEGTDDVGVDVRSWSSVFDVALSLRVCGGSGDADGGSTIGDSVGEGVA